MSPPASERAEQTIASATVPCAAERGADGAARRPYHRGKHIRPHRVTPERHREPPDITALAVAQTARDRIVVSPRAARCSPSPRPHGPHGCAGTRSRRDASRKDRRGPPASHPANPPATGP